jgi:hypothetical protein
VGNEVIYRIVGGSVETYYPVDLDDVNLPPEWWLED